MNEQKAREVLGNRIAKFEIFNSTTHNSLGHKTTGEHIKLNGYFSAKELEAIVWWMRNMKK